MTEHRDRYRNLFARLGHPLSKRDGMPDAQIVRAEGKLGIKLPLALRDYYLVAGREGVLNHAFNRLCSPSGWEIHSRKLVFMEENQTVVVWGVSISKTPAQDPMVFQCPLVDGDPDRWHSEKACCSDFLSFMVHLQAAYGGGMPFTASAPAVGDFSVKLKSNWSFGGEVNGMRAYSMQNRVVCVTKWRDLGSDRKAWRIFAGAKSKEQLNAIASDLRVNWDS